MDFFKSYMSFSIGSLILICCAHRSLQACDRPTKLDSNVVISPDQPSYNTYYSFDITCQPGYTLSGPTRCYCTANLTDGGPDYWDPDPGPAKCSGATTPCSKPTFDDTSVVITPDKTSYDTYDVITASCPTGDLQGDDQAQCQPDGTWNFVSQPSCLSSCQAPKNSNGTGSYQHSAQVTFMCDTGYNLISGEDYIDTTCDDGNWNPTVSCLSIGCLAPSIPATVTIVDPSDQYDVDSKVTLMCIGDTTPSGPEFSYCNETGQWDPDPMTLKCRDQCKTPPFDDSRIIHSSDLRKTSGQNFYDHEDIIRFSCMEGIFVDGPWKSTCHNGTWSPPIGGYRPVCKNNCTSPENMSNAGDVFRHSQGHVFECDGTPGMVRMGGPKSVCEDGVWKPRIRCALKKDLRSEL